MNAETVTRREQLDLVALAVGVTLTWSEDLSMAWLDQAYDGRQNVDDAWGPDLCYYDAFSVAAQLGFKIEPAPYYQEVNVSYHTGQAFLRETVGYGPSRGAAQQATVQAIFQVAVKVGRLIKDKESR